MTLEEPTSYLIDFDLADSEHPCIALMRFLCGEVTRPADHRRR